MNKVNIIIFTSTLLMSMMSCEMDSSDSSAETGTGGSTARFTIVNDYLYTVDLQNLHAFDISNPDSIQYQDKLNVGFGIETIFPFKNNLFLGAQNGMYIYDLSTPSSPVQKSFTSHFVSRDPVVVQDDIAYVTLNSWNSELQVYDVSDFSNPRRMTSLPLYKPHGLGIKDSLLFVCDNGLKVFDVSQINNIHLINYYVDIDARDVIVNGDYLLVVGPKGMSQYSINSGGTLTLVSTVISNNS